ncbi:UNVERIFIED_CONTAM: Gag-Pol polyprotein [Sesamum latifolium]|uniref:Gag-Pol polyprotein n=1 Tax=Sesamum latifolium TaxID=2727402 RepID=A0AAW2WE12_9LAMI
MAHDEASISVPTWSLYVDGSSTAIGSGAGIVLESPQGDKLEYAIKLEFPASNNEAEYEALLAGGELALAVGAKKIVVCSDSQLVVNQIQGSYEARGEKMAKYLLKAKELLDKFEESSLIQVSRADNVTADQLAKISSSIAAIRNRRITYLSSDRAAVEQQVEILCMNPPPTSWKEDIVRFLTQGTTSGDPKEAKAMIVKAARFVMIDGALYKRGFSQPFLKCLTPEEGNYVLRETREGICGNHLGGKALAGKVVRQDLVGLFPQATGQRKFLIVVVDYFTKWVEAEPLAKITEKEVIKFLWKNIVCRFGIPHALISDNGTQFSGKKLKEWCEGLAIKQFFTSVSNPQANGQTEVTNRTILQHLKTRLGTAKGAWVEELPSVLWAYRTTPRTSTGESPFTLSYGTEAVAPAEIGELSWRVKYYDAASNAQGLRMNLDFIDEAREMAAARAAMYKARMAKAYNARVKPRNFQVGDLVLRKAEASSPVGKLDPKWEGPYKVVEIVNGRAYKL